MTSSNIKFKSGEIDTPAGKARLGQICGNIVSAAAGAPGNLVTRWQVSQDMFEGKAGASSIDLDTPASEREVNLVYPLVQEANDAISEQLLGTKPYCQVVPLNGDTKRADELEKGIQAICDTMQFGEQFREQIEQGFIRSIGLSHIPFTENGFEFNVIRPEDFFVYPQHKPGFESVQFAAHRVRMVRIEVEDKIRSGEFSNGVKFSKQKIKPDDAAMLAVDYTNLTNQGEEGSSIHSSVSDFDVVELLDCKIKVRVNGEPCWYRAVIDNGQSVVLLVEDWPYGELCEYVATYLSRDANQFYDATSLVFRLHNLQYAKSQFWAMTELGAEMESFPPVIGDLGLNKKDKPYKPGTIVHGVAAGSAQVIQGRANPQISSMMIPLIDEEAQKITKISKVGVGTEPGNITATASMQLGATQQRAEGSISDRAAVGLEAIWRLIIKKCKAHPVEVKKAYPFLDDGFFGAIEGLGESFSVQSVGRDPSVNPVYKRQALIDLYHLASEDPEHFDLSKIRKTIAESLDIPQDISDFWIDDETREKRKIAGAQWAVPQGAQGMAGGAVGIPQDGLGDQGNQPSGPVPPTGPNFVPQMAGQ